MYILFIQTIAAIMALKFASNLSFMFTEVSSIIDRYQLAKEAGFKTVESGFPFGFSVEQVAAAKKKAGVDQVLLNVFTGMLHELTLRKNNSFKRKQNMRGIKIFSLISRTKVPYFCIINYYFNVIIGDVTKGELGFAAIPDEEENFKRSIEKTIEYAKALDCKM